MAYPVNPTEFSQLPHSAVSQKDDARFATFGFNFNNFLPAPPGGYTVTTYGSAEAGGGTIQNLPSGSGYAIAGPLVTGARQSFREVVSVSGSGPFKLDYQFTDGVNWYNGQQVVSTSGTADGSAYTNFAHLKITTGVYWQIVVFNTGASPINLSWEKRLFKKGKRSK
jgi:hypothetical protein